jgi:hypothetical protein
VGGSEICCGTRTAPTVGVGCTTHSLTSIGTTKPVRVQQYWAGLYGHGWTGDRIRGGSLSGLRSRRSGILPSSYELGWFQRATPAHLVHVRHAHELVALSNCCPPAREELLDGCAAARNSWKRSTGRRSITPTTHPAASAPGSGASHLPRIRRRTPSTERGQFQPQPLACLGAGPSTLQLYKRHRTSPRNRESLAWLRKQAKAVASITVRLSERPAMTSEISFSRGRTVPVRTLGIT